MFLLYTAYLINLGAFVNVRNFGWNCKKLNDCFLHHLYTCCTLTAVFLNGSDMRHDFATKALSITTNTISNCSSAHVLLLLLSTWLHQPMRLHTLCPAAWSATPTFPPLYPSILHFSPFEKKLNRHLLWHRSSDWKLPAKIIYYHWRNKMASQ